MPMALKLLKTANVQHSKPQRALSRGYSKFTRAAEKFALPLINPSQENNSIVSALSNPEEEKEVLVKTPAWHLEDFCSVLSS